MVKKNGHDMLLGELKSSIENIKERLTAGTKRMEDIEIKVETQRKDNSARIRPLEEFKGKILGAVVVLAVVVSTITAVVTIFLSNML